MSGSRSIVDVHQRRAPPEPTDDRSGPESVSAVVHRIERALTRDVGSVAVVGEVSSFRPWRNGYWYFDLKDQRSVLPAVMRPAQNSRVPFAVEDGMQVLARGRVGLYRAQARTQLLVSSLEQLGRGQLLERLEALKQKLAADGLFDPTHKRPLPRLPTTVGVVTSPEGAAIRDIIKVIRHRAPTVSVILSPTRVQGRGASKDIAAALGRLIRSGRCDVIIVGRGGGSLEDLMSFNMEIVARTIAGSGVPIISSVGHETDQTIADLVADVRAATPSHAAELCVPLLSDLTRELQNTERRLYQAARNRVTVERLRLVELRRLITGEKSLTVEYQNRLRDLSERLARVAPARAVSERRARLHALSGRLIHARPGPQVAQRRRDVAALSVRLMQGTHGRRRAAEDQLRSVVGRLEALSPLAVLDRGYTMAMRDGRLVPHALDVNVGDSLELRFVDGVVEATVDNVRHLDEQRPSLPALTEDTDPS